MTHRFRGEFPKLFELLDAQPTPLPQGVSFPALDHTIDEYPQKRKFLQNIDVELQVLDAAAWAALKAKLTPLPERDKKRGLQALYDVLNEAERVQSSRARRLR
jgi:hypothetical protein